MAHLPKQLRAMKRIMILTAAAMVLASCGTFVPQQRSVITAFLDYRPYTSQGFFLSPDPYTGEHDALGELFIEVLPEKKEARIDSEGNPKGDLDMVTYTFEGAYGFERIYFDELLALGVEKAKEMGADGICNLKIRKTSATGFVCYEVTGLCIKRK